MDRIYYQTLTVPAGSGVQTITSQSWALEDNQLKELTVQVPDGHCGLTGFRISRAQQQIIPFANNSYIVSNDRTFTFPFEDEVTSTGLVLQGYNLDIFPHTFYVTATVTNLPLPGELPEAEVTTADTSTVPDLTDIDDLTPDSILDTSGNDTGNDELNPPPVISIPPVVTSPIPAPAKKPPVKHTVAKEDRKKK